MANSNPSDYAWISIQNGKNVNTNPNAIWENGQPFFWANPVANTPVTVTGCSGFCVADTYNVPAPSAGQQYGLGAAKLLLNPTNWNFGPENPNEWNTPGQPHIVNPPTVDRQVA